MKKHIFTALFILFSGVCCYSQTVEKNICETKLEESSSLLDKTLDAFEKLKIAKMDVDSQLVTEKSLRAKEEIYNQELLKAVALLTSSEKRSKSFFEKLRAQIGKVLTAVTDPKQIAAVVSIILILDRLKK